MRNTDRLHRLVSGKLKSRSRSNPSHLIAILLFLATMATPAFSRSRDALMGTLLGTVRTMGPNGQSYNATGAKVRLESTAQTNSLFVLADDSGEFKFGSVSPGSYKLEVALEGFEDTDRTITIDAGETAIENIKFEIKCFRGETASELLKQTNLQTVTVGNELFQDALPLIPFVVRKPNPLMNIKRSRLSQSGLTVAGTILRNCASQRGK